MADNPVPSRIIFVVKCGTMQKDGSTLSHEEHERYSRQILLSEIGIEKQELLKAARVLIVGVGGLGSPISLYLAAAGVGVLGLVESDKISLSNLQRQILYGTGDLGQSKLQVAKQKLELLNPHVSVFPHEVNLTAKNAKEILIPYDIIVDATDNFATRYLLNDSCIILNKPLIYGSVSQFKGLTSLISPGKGPCYRCLYPSPPPIEAVPSCTDGGVLGVIPGTIALLQATEVLKFILGIGTSLAGRVLFFDGLDTRIKEIQLKKDPNCSVCSNSEEHISFDTLHSSTSELCASAFELTAEQLRIELDSGIEIELIDVREPIEAANSKIENSKLIPLKELPIRLTEISRSHEIVLYCKSGVRSAKALKILKESGFGQVRNLKGGIEAYQRLNEVQSSSQAEELDHRKQ